MDKIGHKTLPFKLDRSSYGKLDDKGIPFKLDRGTWSVASIDVTVF